MPKISVVIPAYNAEKTIKETLESVLAQTYRYLEILVIDDGSIDNTVKICQEIADERLRILSYGNAGLAASRNRGIDRATGEYISFIDADDLWTRDKLELQFKALQENPQAVLAYSWTDYIDEASQFAFAGRHITLNGHIFPDLLLNNCLENGSNALIRRDIFSELGRFDESLTAAEDWDMWLRIAARYPFVCVPSVQILYRLSSASMSANLARQELETVKVIDRAFTASPELDPSLKQRSLANLYKYLAWKALDAAAISEPSLTPLRFTWNYICYEPNRFQEAKFAAILLVKSAIASLLPPQQAKTLLARLKKS